MDCPRPVLKCNQALTVSGISVLLIQPLVQGMTFSYLLMGKAGKICSEFGQSGRCGILSKDGLFTRDGFLFYSSLGLPVIDASGTP